MIWWVLLGSILLNILYLTGVIKGRQKWTWQYCILFLMLLFALGPLVIPILFLVEKWSK